MSAESLITLTIDIDCKYDSIVSIEHAEDQDYVYLIDPFDVSSLTINHVLENSLSVCQTDFEVMKFENGDARPLISGTETSTISKDSDNGAIVISTGDTVHDEDIWTLVIIATSLDSETENREMSLQFTVQFLDVCWLSELQPPTFEQVSYEFTLWEDTAFFSFTEMKDLSQGTLCGGYGHRLEYVSGPSTTGGSEFTMAYSQ
jgi:hypothetical protein